MVVLTKKKIISVIITITIFIFSYMIIENKIINKDKKEVVQTVALPTNNKVIILDAGHGKPDERSREQ